MKKGFTLIELMIVIAIIAIIAAIAIPNLIRAQANANQTAARTGCTTVMSETETFRTSKGVLPTKIGDFTGRLDKGILDSMYFQDLSVVDAIVNTGTAQTATAAALADGSAVGNVTGSYKSHRFMYLSRLAGGAAASAADDMIRAVMVLPTRWDKGGENAYYRTNESGTTYLQSECFVLCNDTCTQTKALASGANPRFIPLITSLFSTLVLETNLNTTTWSSK